MVSIQSLLITLKLTLWFPVCVTDPPPIAYRAHRYILNIWHWMVIVIMCCIQQCTSLGSLAAFKTPDGIGFEFIATKPMETLLGPCPPRHQRRTPCSLHHAIYCPRMHHHGHLWLDQYFYWPNILNNTPMCQLRIGFRDEIENPETCVHEWNVILFTMI